MPKVKISEYSTTNADNTDIEGINIAEGCAPSGINNAIRELMVHLKEFQTGASGDGFTFAGGTLMTGTNTLSGTNVLSGSTTAAFAAGTVSAPSIAAHGDTNTGIFFPAADTIAFAEGGAEAMRIDSSGNVGIGATATQFGTAYRTVEIAGTDGAIIRLRGSSDTVASQDAAIYKVAGSTGALWLRNYANGPIGFMTNNTERVRIDENGNVGIGTTSPTDLLSVGTLGTTVASIITIGSSTTGTGNIYFGDGTGTSRYRGYIQYGQAGDSMAFGTAATEAMRIDSSGNVGIGTSSPSYKLDLSATTAAVNIRISNNAITTFLGQGGTGSTTTDLQTNGALRFTTGDNYTERARITSGGYFKASDNGTYYGVSSSYHEFVNTTNNTATIDYNKNASFSIQGASGGVNSVVAVRSATSAYSLLCTFSNDASDVEHNLRGDGNAYADGTWNNNGADYAEFFESANGQALTLGATVVLDGTKVREAIEQDDPKNIIGVVRPKEPSKASMVVGNTAWNKWANKYLTDDFDRYIMEDHDVVEWEEQVLEKEAVAAVEAVLDEEGNEVSAAIPAQEAVYKTVKHSYESHNIPAGITVPAEAVRKTHDDKGNKFQHYKLNPAWDKDAEYTPREKRPEWNIIGLLGQVKILKGQPVSDRWIKMRDVSATVEEWMIR